jgi:hypothetical protein
LLNLSHYPIQNISANAIDKQTKMQNKERQQLFGWCLFILSAIFYIASSIKAKDILSLVGGLFFLFACLVFLKELIISK